jgi:hypothetical protein
LQSRPASSFEQVRAYRAGEIKAPAARRIDEQALGSFAIDD